MKKFTFLKMTLLAVVIMAGSMNAFGQTEIFKVAPDNALPAGWVGTNNITTQNIIMPIKTSYYILLEAGVTADVVTTSTYDLSSYGTLTFNAQVASYATGVANPLKIEYSTDDGATWATTSFTTVTPPTSTFIAGGPVTINGTFTATTKFRFTNNGTAGKGVRVQNLILSAAAANTPAITTNVTSLSGFSYTYDNGPSAEQTFTVSASNLTSDLTAVASTGYEVSLTSGTGFAPSLTLTPVSGTVENTSVYVRLATGLAAGAHTGDITLSSTSVASKTISLSGNVLQPVTMPAVIISEVYGGGGNSGAIYPNDFIELYNTSSSQVDIGGWSVQYFSSTGVGTSLTTNVFEIPSGKYIPVGAHFLIQCAAGTNPGTKTLPTVDAVSTLALGGSAGKVILFKTNTAQTISDLASILTNADFVDYIPYGTAAIPVWGTAMASNMSSTTSATRNTASAPSSVGQKKISAALNYAYTGNIGADFSAATPTPESTGIVTGLNAAKADVQIWTSAGRIHFAATAGETVEIFNVAGQRVASRLTTDGINTVGVQATGVMIVKVGNRIGKVIL